MKLRLKITGNTDATATSPHKEAAEILRRALAAVEATEGGTTAVVIESLKDTNGNSIGSFRFDPVNRPKHEKK